MPKSMRFWRTRCLQRVVKRCHSRTHLWAKEPTGKILFSNWRRCISTTYRWVAVMISQLILWAAVYTTNRVSWVWKRPTSSGSMAVWISILVCRTNGVTAVFSCTPMKNVQVCLKTALAVYYTIRSMPFPQIRSKDRTESTPTWKK